LHRSQSRTQPATPDHFEIPDEKISAESALMSQARKEQVRRVLQLLPHKDRELPHLWSGIGSS
jgi:hypothetical protein